MHRIIDSRKPPRGRRRSIAILMLGVLLTGIVMVAVGVMMLNDRVWVVHEQVNEQWAGVETVLRQRYAAVGTMLSVIRKSVPTDDVTVLPYLASIESLLKDQENKLFAPTQPIEEKVRIVVSLESESRMLVEQAARSDRWSADPDFLSAYEHFRRTHAELKNALRRYNEASRIYHQTLQSAAASRMARYLELSTNAPYVQPGE